LVASAIEAGFHTGASRQYSMFSSMIPTPRSNDRSKEGSMRHLAIDIALAATLVLIGEPAAAHQRRHADRPR